MPLPGDITTITVTGDYTDITGAPLSGALIFTPTADLTDLAGHVILRVTPSVAGLVNGAFSITLPCTDNVTITPASWAWTVAENLYQTGKPLTVRTYTILLPHTLGTTVDISTLAPVNPPTPYSTIYLLVSNNLSDLTSVSTARTNLGLGGAAVLNVGTTAGTVAAGNDSRITGAIQPANAATTVTAQTSYGQAAAVGVDTTYAREDHAHGTVALTTNAPAVIEGIGQAAAVGTATAPARADHVHALAAAAAPTASAVGDTSATGSATTFAGSDHRHARESFAAPGTSAVGDAAAAGASASVSRADHIHGRESFGIVTAQTSFGASSTNGTAATPARSDHTHGTPAAPTPASIGAVPTSAEGVAGGVATLDGGGHLTAAQLPTNVLTTSSYPLPAIEAVSVKTSTYTLTAADAVILADATTAAFVVTLPTAVGTTGTQYEIKKIDASINPVTVATTSAQTIDGATQVIIFSGGDSIRITSDGANWRQI